MGRWLKKLENMPTAEPTKLTQHASVGFVGSTSGHPQKNNIEKIGLTHIPHP